MIGVFTILHCTLLSYILSLHFLYVLITVFCRQQLSTKRVRLEEIDLKYRREDRYGISEMQGVYQVHLITQKLA